jgi:hypothetical protein
LQELPVVVVRSRGLRLRRRRMPFTVAHGRRARGSAVDPRGRASCGSAPALAQGDALELGALGVVHDAIEKGGGEPVTN